MKEHYKIIITTSSLLMLGFNYWSYSKTLEDAQHLLIWYSLGMFIVLFLALWCSKDD